MPRHLSTEQAVQTMTTSPLPRPPSMTTPHRQIRALYNDETITVYQAYNSTIASAAVAEQRLDASPLFRTSRMTWIKPSWAWMLYRSGYSYKDPGQERILALTIRHADFIRLLERGVLSHAPTIERQNVELDDGEVNLPRSGPKREKLPGVRIQWDPERTVRLGRLEHRSIQIGIPGSVMAEFIAGIVRIEDVTDRARELKKTLDEKPDITDQQLMEMGLAPVERVFEISEDLQRVLGMV
jgi:hypothetical protein